MAALLVGGGGFQGGGKPQIVHAAGALDSTAAAWTICGEGAKLAAVSCGCGVYN
jgi:hypothetical protein